MVDNFTLLRHLSYTCQILLFSQLLLANCVIMALNLIPHPVGDPAGDRHPREGVSASTAISGLWEAHTESSHQGAQVQRD